MSLKYEQYHSLKMTKEFLQELLMKTKPRKEIKEKIRMCLRHFPVLEDSGKPIFSSDNLTEDK